MYAYVLRLPIVPIWPLLHCPLPQIQRSRPDNSAVAGRAPPSRLENSPTVTLTVENKRTTNRHRSSVYHRPRRHIISVSLPPTLFHRQPDPGWRSSPVSSTASCMPAACVTNEQRLCDWHLTSTGRPSFTVTLTNVFHSLFVQAVVWTRSDHDIYKQPLQPIIIISYTNCIIAKKAVGKCLLVRRLSYLRRCIHSCLFWFRLSLVSTSCTPVPRSSGY